MQRFVEVPPLVRAGRGFVRVQLIDLGLDGMTQILDPQVLTFSPHAAMGLLKGAEEAVAELKAFEAKVERLRA